MERFQSTSVDPGYVCEVGSMKKNRKIVWILIIVAGLAVCLAIYNPVVYHWDTNH